MGCPTTDRLGVRLMVVKLAILALAAAVASDQLAKPGCDDKCGELEIPYPFGMSEECYLNINFSITCNTTHYNPPKAFLMTSDVEVTNLSIIDGQLQILQYVAQDCYTKDGPSNSNEATLTVPMFTISSTKNKFTVIGCDTVAYLYGELEGQTYTSGCVGWCKNDNITKVREGSCSGNGCCQLEIPKGLKDLRLEVKSFYNHTKVLDFNPCGYGFAIQEDNFTFSSKYIRNFPQERVPLVLDWGIKTDTCLTADHKTNCLCGPNTQRNSSFLDDGSEYRCHCSKGFEGNPYLPQGCQNINECERDDLHDCLDKDHCNDRDGNYSCYCPKNYKGDGRREGKGCTPNSKSFIPIIIGIGVGFVVLLIGSTWLYLGYKKWKFIQRKEKFFKNNGGFLLQQHLSQWQSPVDTVRIFTQEELEKATNKFDESTVAGTGGFGTVYKGLLDDGLVVAIKKSKLVDQSQIDQFINEVIVLSQINHRHVVKLLGCCLETQVPLLVYEFITNGTLFDHIHDKTNYNSSLPWETRLKIASETAGVVSYLHSSAFIPIIHRDIKSTNILLDANYTAKVSDFGASKLVPMDQTQLSTMVQGTLGYLDPEYLLTSELTEKSDVYSFGIVLMELITGKKAVCFDGPEAERNLAMYVLCAMKEDRLEQVVENGMATEANIEQIKEVARVAKECVRVKGEERPSMKEVAMELEGLRVMQIEHSWANDNLSRQEEMVNLLDETSESSNQLFDVSHRINNAMDNSITIQVLTHIPDAR